VERPQADVHDSRRGRTTLTATNTGAPSRGEDSQTPHRDRMHRRGELLCSHDVTRLALDKH
jgi:hypothetical protein